MLRATVYKSTLWLGFTPEPVTNTVRSLTGLGLIFFVTKVQCPDLPRRRGDSFGELEDSLVASWAGAQRYASDG